MNQTESKITLNELLFRKAEIERIVSILEEKQAAEPKGSLRIAKKRNGYQYYHLITPNTLGKYIHSKDKSLTISLAQKDYDHKLLAALKKQLKVLDDFFTGYNPSGLQQVYENLTDIRKQLVTPLFISDEAFVEQWLNTPYSHLGFSKDDPEFYTAKGERVRSKSEILIADALLRHNIPYRYEFPLYSHGVLIAAPDFNCLNVRLRKDYYWEHLGMMGMEKYADRNTKKINKYFLADDFDENRLILTMETDNIPLNTRVIEQKILKYLL